jgi:triosephosphate isomerase
MVVNMGLITLNGSETRAGTTEATATKLARVGIETSPLPSVVMANWKSANVNVPSAAESLTKEILELFSGLRERNVWVTLCPGYTALDRVASVLKWASNSHVALGAQDIYDGLEADRTSAVTAEVFKGMPQVREVIVGHSETRVHFGVTDYRVNCKIRRAHEYGLTPTLCVGEDYETRFGRGNNAKTALSFILAQLRLALDGIVLPEHRVSDRAMTGDSYRFRVAYEPLWAINTAKVATPELVAEVCEAIRQELVRLYGVGIGSGIRILYGGSVKPENAAKLAMLAAMNIINGVLVGGASLTATDLWEIVKAFGLAV